MKVLDFLPLISQEIREELALSCVDALQNVSDCRVQEYVYFIAYLREGNKTDCFISKFEGDMISIAKKYPVSQFFKLKIKDNKPNIIEL